MFRLITVCAAIVLSCVIAGGYLGSSESPVESMLSDAPTKGDDVAGTRAVDASAATLETTDEADEDSDDTASDDTANDGGGDVANAGPDDDHSDGTHTTPDEWTPGELPGKAGK